MQRVDRRLCNLGRGMGVAVHPEFGGHLRSGEHVEYVVPLEVASQLSQVAVSAKEPTELVDMVPDRCQKIGAMLSGAAPAE